MGHVKKNKLDIQKERLKKLFVGMMETTIDVLNFQMTLAKEQKDISGIKKLIRTTTKAIDIIKNVQHYEILVSLYNSFVNGKETYFVAMTRTIVSKNTITKWDKSERGFKLFKELEKEAIAKSEKELEEKRKENEMLEQAKKEGKKVELLYKDGKVKRVIVEEKTN